MHWIPKERLNVANMTPVDHLAFDCRAALHLQFYNRHFQSNSRVRPKLPNSGRCQCRISGLNVVNSDRISDIIPQNNVGPDAPLLAVRLFYSAKETLFDIIRLHARNSLGFDASAEVAMNRGSI